MISQQLTTELQQILRENHGIDLSFEQASEVGRELSDFFDLLAEIDYQNKNKKNNLVSN